MKEIKNKGSVRIVRFYGFMVLTTALVALQNYFENVRLDKTILFYLMFAAFLLSAFSGIRIYRMKKKQSSKLLTIIFSLLAVVLIAIPLILKDLGIFIWNECYLSFPFFLFSLVLFFASLLTELRKQVLIYMSLTGLEFVKRSENEN